MVVKVSPEILNTYRDLEFNHCGGSNKQPIKKARMYTEMLSRVRYKTIISDRLAVVQQQNTLSSYCGLNQSEMPFGPLIGHGPAIAAWLRVKFVNAAVRRR